MHPERRIVALGSTAPPTKTSFCTPVWRTGAINNARVVSVINDDRGSAHFDSPATMSFVTPSLAALSIHSRLRQSRPPARGSLPQRLRQRPYQGHVRVGLGPPCDMPVAASSNPQKAVHAPRCFIQMNNQRAPFIDTSSISGLAMAASAASQPVFSCSPRRCPSSRCPFRA